jgi:hypothetical protein
MIDSFRFLRQAGKNASQALWDEITFRKVHADFLR